jgi:hypothetical protein
MSYGGSSMLSIMIGLAIVMSSRISKYWIISSITFIIFFRQRKKINVIRK